MTVSPKALTETVIAQGNILEGRGQWEQEEARYNADPAAYQEEMRLQMKHELLDAIMKRARDPKKHLDNDDIILMGQLKRELAPPRKKNRHDLGPREFTLTYSPKWFATDADARIAMSGAMDKLMKYYKEDITQLRAVGEVGKNGLSHIHCYYELEGGKKITDKNFKRAWSYWDPTKLHGKGFQGGHHETVKNAADFLGYIDKEIDNAWFEIKCPL